MPRPNQRVISLPRGLVDEVESFIEDHPGMSYTSIADFVKAAIRLRVAVDVQIEDLRRDAAEVVADDARHQDQVHAVRQLLETGGLSPKHMTPEDLLRFLRDVRQLVATAKTSSTRVRSKKRTGAKREAVK